MTLGTNEDLLDSIDQAFSAARERDIEQLRTVLESIIDENGRSPIATPVFHYAASENLAESIPILLEFGADPKNTKKHSPKTNALGAAIESGSTDAIEKLIECGVDPNDTGDTGEPSIVFALSNGFTDIALSLVRLGADVSLREERGGKSALHESARVFDTTVMSAIIEANGDVNGLDNGGNTPFHTAAFYGNTEGFEILLERGADPLARNKDNREPVFFACAMDHVEAVKWLEKKGACLFDRDKLGSSPINIAFAQKARNVIFHLVEDGLIGINECFRDGDSARWTAEERAKECGWSEVLALCEAIRLKNRSEAKYPNHDELGI